jgi:hypothetical protein
MMIERVYLTILDHSRKSGAGVILTGLGGYVVYIDQDQSIPQSMKDYERVVIFVADEGEFPNKYLRVLPNREDAQRQGFPVPDVFEPHLSEGPVTIVAIRPDACDIRQLRTPLTNMHLRERSGKWTGLKRKSPSRIAHSQSFQQRHRLYAHS